MSLPKKVWQISSFHKGVGNFSVPGMFWWAQNLDFDITPPFMRMAMKFFEETGESNYVGNAKWGTLYNNYNYIINQTDGQIFQYTTAWASPHTIATGGLGIFGDIDYLYYANSAYAGRYSGSTWTDAWQAFKVSNESDLVPIKKFLKFVCFGNQNYLAVWDIGASAWDDDRIILPTGYKIKWLQPLSDFFVICAHHSNYGSVLFIWDGISQTYNDAVRLPGITALAGELHNGNLYVITDDGWINKFTGAVLDPIVHFPDMDTGDTISINPDAMRSFQQLIYIGKGGSNDLSKRYLAGGIWVFNPATEALYFKHTLSNSGITNVAGSGVLSIGTIFITPNSQTLKAVWHDGTHYKVDASRTSGSIQPYPYGAFYVSPIYDNEPFRRKRFIQEVANFFKPLPSGSKVIIKQNTTEAYQRETVTPSGGTSAYFSVSSVGSSWEVGDEITVLSGGGAGQIRHISAIDTTLKRITVDEVLSGSANFDSTSRISISAFKKIGEISGNDVVINKLLRFNARAKKIQLKVELRVAAGSIGQWNVGIANLSTIFIPDRTIK